MTFFNINNNHWVTAFISVKEKLLCYIDPFGADQATESKMLDNVNRWMFALNRPKLNILHLEQTIQTDSYNCGVYSCVFMKKLLDELNNQESIKETSLIVKDIKKERKKIYHMVMVKDFQ